MKRNLNLKLIFIKDITRDVVNESRIKAGEVLARNDENRTGMTLIRPGGRNCYPSFWIRDFAMSLESTLISTKEITVDTHTGKAMGRFSNADHPVWTALKFWNKAYF